MKRILIAGILAVSAAGLSAGEMEDLGRAAALEDGIKLDYPAAPERSPRAALVQDFFDEWGDGVGKIPAAMARNGIKVLAVETRDNITTVVYEPGGPMVRMAETKGEYGPGDGARIEREVKTMVKELETGGKVVIWTGRRGDIVYVATVYYLERTAVAGSVNKGVLIDTIEILMAERRRGQIRELDLRFQGKTGEADKLKQKNDALTREIDRLLAEAMGGKAGMGRK